MSEVPQSASPAWEGARTVVPGVRWYHIADPASPVLDELARHFAIHALQVEDWKLLCVALSGVLRTLPETHLLRCAQPLLATASCALGFFWISRQGPWVL